jgi:hypothetical protein
MVITSIAGPCKICGIEEAVTKLLICTGCHYMFHRHCLQLTKFGYMGSTFVCAGCLRMEAGVPSNALTDDLANELVSLSAQSVQASSQSTYFYGLQRFLRFTELAQVPRHIALPTAAGSPIPANIIRLFLVWAKDHYAINSIQITLAAIHEWHRSKHIVRDNQEVALINSTLKQVRVLLGPLGHSDQKLGLSVELLRILCDHIKGCVPTAASWVLKLLLIRDLVWLLVSFFGFLRRSEAAALRLSDLEFDTTHSPPAVKVRVRKSKTDAMQRGVTICLAWTTASGFMIGDTLQLFVTMLLVAKYPLDFPLFMSLGTANGGFLNLRTPMPLRADTMSGRLQGYLKTLSQQYPGLIGDVKKYSAHSLRRGGATAAWLAGVPREVLAVHGRWRSDAVDVYLVADTSQKLLVTRPI